MDGRAEAPHRRSIHALQPESWAFTGVPAGILSRRSTGRLERVRRSCPAPVNQKLFQPTGFDIFCRVDLTVMNRAALWTDPTTSPVIPRMERVPRQPTGRTAPGGREIPVYLNKCFSLAGQLVAQHLPEHPEPRLLYGAPGLNQRVRHRTQIVAPHTYGIPGVGYPPGFLVEEVSALIGDVLMEQAVFQYGFLIIFEPGCIRFSRR